MTSIRRHWKHWLIGAIVVLVVGGRLVIHKIEGKSAPPLTLGPAATTTTGAAGAAASTAATSSGSAGGPVIVDGTWKVATGSQAGYRIKETLFGVSNTATGRTAAVTGSITISGTAVSAGNFSVDLTTVASDRPQRDGQFQGRIMNTARYPTATFTLTQPIQLATVPPDGAQITSNATGDLTMHGTTKTVTFAVTAERTGATIGVQGAIPISFADYNISNPSGGPATTGDNGTLEFLIKFSHN